MSDEFGKVFDNMFEKLEKFIRTETVVGEPFQVGSTTLIPIISVSFGAAGGGGSGKDKQGSDGSGQGGGLGCKISPNAILVIRQDEVNVISLTGKGSVDKLLEMVPEVLERMGQSGEEQGEGGEN